MTAAAEEINVHEIYGNVIANLSAFTLHFLNCGGVGNGTQPETRHQLRVFAGLGLALALGEMQKLKQK